MSDKPTFPLTVRSHLGLKLTLLDARKDGKRRIVYSFHPRGEKREKQVIPADELRGTDGEVPEDGTVPQAAIEWALRFLEAKAVASTQIGRRMLAATGERLLNDITLAEVFARARATKAYVELSKGSRDEYDRVMRWVTVVLGPAFNLASFDQDTVDELLKKRTTVGIVVPATQGEGTTRRLKAASHNTARKEVGMLRTLLSWVNRVKSNGRWVLDAYPFERLDLPKVHDRKKKERILPERYELMRDIAPEIDPQGRFLFLLDLARWFGMRESTWVRFQRRFILFTADEIEAALYEQKNPYVPPEKTRGVAELYAANGGAIYAPWWTQKQALDKKPGWMDYDRVIPMGPRVSACAHQYVEDVWPKFGLSGGDAPLFPSDWKYGEGIHSDTAQKWWASAENLIRAKGTPLRKLEGTRWHGFRLQRLHELRTGVDPRIDDIERFFTVGWSTNAGAGGRDENNLSMAEGVYGRADAQELVRASKVGEGNVAPGPKLVRAS